MNIYQKLVTIPPKTTFCSHEVAETSDHYNCLTERHIQVMWLEQKYFKNLHTIDNIPITVLSPGIWNNEAGPDFLKAHLRIGDKEYRGDVELHLSEDSWYHHRHHLDKNYDHVILHVSFWQSNKERSILTSEGRALERTHLKKHLTIAESRLTKLIDLELYPHHFFAGSGYCSRHLFQNLSSKKTTTLFQSASMWRLEQKRQMLEEKSNSYCPFITGMAMALGYKNNSEAFRDLFFHLKSLSHLEEQALFAYALGKCNFFNSHYLELWKNSPYYQFLADIFAKLPLTDYILPALRLNKIRPSNHPVRRLSMLVRLCKMPENTKFIENIKSQWDPNIYTGNKKSLILMRNKLCSVIPRYDDDYWRWHYMFEESRQTSPINIFGDDLCMEILVNVILPILYEEVQKKADPQELEIFLIFFNSLPASKSQKSTYLANRFFGDHFSDHIFSKRDLQQGAYQLHRDFCIHFEASCIGCPFVDRYKITSEVTYDVTSNSK